MAHQGCREEASGALKKRPLDIAAEVAEERCNHRVLDVRLRCLRSIGDRHDPAIQRQSEVRAKGDIRLLVELLAYLSFGNQGLVWKNALIHVQPLMQSALGGASGILEDVHYFHAEAVLNSDMLDGQLKSLWENLGLGA